MPGSFEYTAARLMFYILYSIFYITDKAPQLSIRIRRDNVQPDDFDAKFLPVKLLQTSAEEFFDFPFCMSLILRITHQLDTQIMISLLHIAELGDSGNPVWNLAQLQN